MTPEEIEEHISILLDSAINDQKVLNINKDNTDDWNKAVDGVIERLEKLKKAPVTDQSKQGLKQ